MKNIHSKLSFVNMNSIHFFSTSNFKIHCSVTILFPLILISYVDGSDFFWQHFISRFSGSFIQNITQLSKELNLPLDNSPSPPPTINPAVENIAGVSKPVQNNLPGILGDAKLTAWELWQKQEFSFLKIAVSYCCFHFCLLLMVYSSSQLNVLVCSSIFAEQCQ